MDIEPKKIREFFVLRESECRTKGSALERKLGPLRLIRRLTLGLGVVSGAIGGAAVFSELLGPKAAVICGAFALASAILTGLHNVYHCDAYQADCERLIGVYESLAGDYQDAQVCPDDELLDYQKTLGKRFSAANSEAAASAFAHRRKKAESEIPNEAVTDKPA